MSTWRLGQDGWVGGLRHVPSPHFDARPTGVALDLLVVHHISLPPGEFGGSAIEALFTGRLDIAAHPFYAQLAGVRVSAHFLIQRDGLTTQFVSCSDRAWHAGASTFRGRDRCNDFSIGIELEGTGETPYTARQYASLARLARCLTKGLALDWIAGHSDVAPGRKTDPGPSFDWARLHSRIQNLGLQRPF